MTSFNAVGVILPLDEYWKKCVNPKPLIPPKYSGTSSNSHRPGVNSQDGHHQQGGHARQAIHRQVGHRQVGHRQAGHLRSYKDLQESDDDEDDAVAVDERVKNSQDGSADSEFNSNVSQINYEIDDFNKTYCDESSPWQGESSSSHQWNYHVNRTQPNAGQKANVKSRLDLNCKNRLQKRNWHKKTNWNRNNNGNTSHHNHLGVSQNRCQQHARFTSMEQRMRYAYNSFRDNNNLEQSSSNVLMNHKYNLQTIPQNAPKVHSSSITSMIDSVSNLSDNRTYNRSYVRYETSISSLNDGHVAGGTDVNNPEPGNNVLQGNPIKVDGSAPNDYTVQQVARHVMLMMSAVRNNDTQATPEFFKNKKSMKGAGNESHIEYKPQGSN